ncbi:hypothetical protein JGH11_15565 [Dysgonomonas sp. Marseille-P4677]|uniref:hypothetical protein n=1 Tax=Dysgonomonas sp. Marseille-P4677 TaxID=2364790 RepID=UPI00191250E5|nr:hypothetical protein [Dysgonomonas sp. Marseille-P4677]MBK5722294.1 hypothetical protein [Dysgonomonas sp. Marseille-P4677]
MKYLHLLLLLLFTCTQLQGQVTIGSGIKPNKGALLDLKEFETTESVKGGTTATKGIMLPRVVLKSLDELTMGDNVINNDTEGTWKAHEGLTVFNVHEDLSKKICRGVYVFNSSSWIKLGEPCPFFFRINCDEIEVSGIYEEYEPVDENNYLTIHLTDIDESAKGEKLSIYTESNSGITFDLETVFSGEPNQTVKVPAYGIPMGSGTFHHDVYINNLECTFIINIGEIPNPSVNCSDASVQGVYIKGKTVNGEQDYISLTLADIPASAKDKYFYIYSNNENGMEFEFEGEYSGESTQIVNVPAIGTPASAGTFTYDLYINYAQCSFNIEVEHTIDCNATKLFGKFIQGKAVNEDQDYVSLTLTNIPESLKDKPLHIYSNEANGIKFELKTTYDGSSTQTVKVPASGTPTTHGDVTYTINVNSLTCPFKVHTFASGNINYTILDSEGIIKIPANWSITLGGRTGRIIMYEEGRYYFDDINTGNIAASEVSLSAEHLVTRVYGGGNNKIYYTLKMPPITVEKLKTGSDILLKVEKVRNMQFYRGINNAAKEYLTSPTTWLNTNMLGSNILSGSQGDTYTPSGQSASFIIGNYYTRSEGDVLTLSFHAFSANQKNMTSQTSNKETYKKNFSIKDIKNGILDFTGDTNLTQLTLRRSFRIRRPILGTKIPNLSDAVTGDAERNSISRGDVKPNGTTALSDNVHYLGGDSNGYASVIINYNDGYSSSINHQEKINFYHYSGLLGLVGSYYAYPTLNDILSASQITMVYNLLGR